MTTTLSLTDKDELARMALDEDTAVSLVEWVERRLDRDRSAANERIAVLEGALAKYGTHTRVPFTIDPDGTEHGLWLCVGDPCKCGLRSTLGATETEPGEAE